MYDVIIIGGGPAGTAAAVYTARKQLKTLLLTESFGGQSIVSDDIQNWIGEKHISGFDLAKKFEEHVRNFPGVVDIKTEKVSAVKAIPSMEASIPLSASVEALGGDVQRLSDFEVTTDTGTYQGKTVIVCSGARRRRLGIPGEDKFDGKGVAFCSTCDAPLFSGKVVAVVGGGDSGMEAAVDLFPYASKIYVLEFGTALKADPVTAEEVRKNSKTEIILNAEAKEVVGEKFVTSIRYADRATNKEKILSVDGIFVEIGSVPNSEMVKGLADIDKYGQVVIDSKHASTSRQGVFAAGDVTDDPYKQNNISAGDGVKAALAAYAYLQKRGRQSPAEEQNNQGK